MPDRSKKADPVNTNLDGDAQEQAKIAVKLGDDNVNSTGDQIDGRRPAESEKPRPEVNRPTVPEVAEPAPEPEQADSLKSKSGEKYYVNRNYSAGSVLVDNDPDGVGTYRFTPYYDTWKGDQVRVGYLATDSKEAQKILENDENVEEISFSDYKLALEGDGKRHQPLGKAPYPASA